MKKQKYFQLIDLVIYFNILIFISVGIVGMNQDIYLALFMVLIGVLNGVAIIFTILLRKKYNINLSHKLNVEIKAEASMDKVNRDAFNHAKQVFLESRIEAEIKDKMPNAKVIRNAFIPRQDGTTSELDLIVISESGIYIIESKNTTGRIMGNWKEDKLVINHPGGKSYDLPNPINQNTSHFYSLRNYLGMKTEVFRSIVVFGDQTIIDTYEGVPYHAQVCLLDKMMYCINKLAKRYNTPLSLHMVDNIYENLVRYVTEDDSKREKHINRVSSIENEQ